MIMVILKDAICYHTSYTRNQILRYMYQDIDAAITKMKSFQQKLH
jgi:hypothetical protein